MTLFNLLFLLYQMIAVAAIIHVVMDNRQPAKATAWALIIWFIPIAGIIAYLFFGVNTRKERLISQRSLDELSKRSMLEFVEQKDLMAPKEHQALIDLFVSQNFALPYKDNQLNVFTSGYEFFPALLAAIGQAKSHIHIDMYIFEDDPLGQTVSDALIAKARQGVEVKVIYDDVGCWSVKNKFFEQMREEGIEVAPFLPVRFPSFTSKANYRNHRKIIVIDGLTGFIGGMNIAMRYVKGLDRQPWRDTMMQISGPGVYALQRAFLVDWYFVDRTLITNKKYYPAPQATTPGALLQVVTGNAASPSPEIMQGYVRTIMGAKDYVYIETPYFLPTEPVFFAMKTAVASGVDVRILVPASGDAHFVEWAQNSYLREAVEAGIQVSLYQTGFLHSKVMVCDDTVATCGSTNIDVRSFENNFESNVFIYDRPTALQLKAMYLDDERQSVLFSEQAHLMKPSFLARLWESFVRLFSPLF